MSAGSIAHIEARRNGRWRAAKVRSRLAEEHREIREVLEETLALTGKLDGERDEDALRLAVRALVLLFGEHLNSEEAILVPALMGISPWGPARAEVLQEDHEFQRALLKRVFAVMNEPLGRDALRDAAETFAKLLLADMESEDELLGFLE